MSLIINKNIPQLMKCYPTVSDKYNVGGGILAGRTPVGFGELVKYSNITGYYEAAANAGTIDKIAGFVVATNVKLANEWPAKTVRVEIGEAFNILYNGFIAIPLDSGAEEIKIKPNAKVGVILTTGKATTSGTSAAEDMPNAYFTGIYEKHDGVIVAEIYVK